MEEREVAGGGDERDGRGGDPRRRTNHRQQEKTFFLDKIIFVKVKEMKRMKFVLLIDISTDPSSSFEGTAKESNA